MNTVQIPQDTLAPLKRGHPWVYTSGLRDSSELPPPGTPVQLVDHKGKGIAFGLADDGPIATKLILRSLPRGATGAVVSRGCWL